MSGTPFAPDPVVEAKASKVEHTSNIPEAAGPDAARSGGFEVPSFWARGSFFRELTVQLLFLAVYILLDRASIEFRLWTGTPAWYLPAGLSVAILLCGGMRYLPILILSSVTVATLSHHPILSLAGLPRSVVVSLSYAGGAAWLRRVWRLDLGLRRLRDIGGLALFLAAVKFPAVLFSALTFLADGLVSRQYFWKTTFNWWVGDSISITSLTPFLLLFVAPWVGAFLQGGKSVKPSGAGIGRRLAPSEALERTAELASVLAALWLVFGFKPAVPYQPLYLLFFPVIWMAVRRGLNRAVLAVLAINLGVIAAAQITPPDPEGMPRRQLVMLALALTGLCVGAVVSERQQAEEALQQKSEELDTFFNVSLDLLCIATIDGYFLRLNPAWEATLGYTRKELQAKRFFDFVHPDDVEATRQATALLSCQQNVVGFINRYRRKDGEYRWLEWRSAPAANLIYAATRDVTEQRDAEETLRRRERELKEAQRLAQVGSWEWDISSDTTRWSEELYRITDRDPDRPHPRIRNFSNCTPASKVAADLNAVSDELGKSIAELDAALKKLNLGVTTWIQVQLVRDPQTADFEGDYLGYAKVGGKWGIALRKTSGNYNYAPDEPPEEWPFNEGPRELRLEAIEKIPELLNKLSEAATKMAANVRDRLGEAQQVAEAIKLVANDPKSSRAASKQTGGH